MNIIKKTFNQSEKNKINEDKLKKKIILDFDYSFNKKKQEIILLDRVQSHPTPYHEQYQQARYEFINLNDKYLKFFHPYVIVSTTSGFADVEYLYHNCFYYWENYTNDTNDIKILRIDASGFFGYYLPKVSPTVPIYITMKIKILNPHIFDTLVRY